jgi:DNA-binding transcriptional LysR family regulator
MRRCYRHRARFRAGFFTAPGFGNPDLQTRRKNDATTSTDNLRPGGAMNDAHGERFVRGHLKMRHLVLLVELGRNASIAQAAQAAHLTQPGASKLIGELEDVLGVQLFERVARGVVPTWYGQILIRRAGIVLAEMTAAHLEIAESMSGVGGHVAIGSVLTPAAGLLPRAIKLLKSRHARVHVAVDLNTSTALVQRLRDGQLDLAIGRVPDTGSAAVLDFEPITDEVHRLLVRPGHPLAARTDLDLTELAAQSWIVPPAGSILRDRLTALFLAAGVAPPQDTVETLAPPLAASLLTMTDMVAALPEALMHTYLDAGLLVVVPCDLGLRMDAYGIVTRKGHQLSPVAQAMLAAVRETAVEYYPGRSRKRAPPSS